MPRSKKVVINHPMNWVETDLSESVKSFYFDVDDDGNVKAIPALVFDPTFNPTAIAGHIKAIDITGVNRNVGSNQLNVNFVPTEGYSYGLNVVAAQFLYNPLTGEMEAVRTPTVTFVLQKTTTGLTAIWTPAAGHVFRLMGGVFQLTQDAACAGQFYASLLDGAGIEIMRFSISNAALVAMGEVVSIPFTLPGNGWRSATAAQALGLNFSAALSAGNATVSVWGTEELI